MTRFRIEHGSMLDILPLFNENSFDSTITDSPYELGFMGRNWDRSGIAFEASTWREVLRVLKPGAYLAAFGGTRTVHRIACAIEDAGFEIRDGIEWLYGSGFPKSLDISKAIDRAAGAELVKRWSGFGTALKPGHEPIVLARKPFKGTVAANVLEHGTGGLNIDGCRVGTSKRVPGSPKVAPASAHTVSLPGVDGGSGHDPNIGRWPPNVALTHSADCKVVGTMTLKDPWPWAKNPSDKIDSPFTGPAVSPVVHTGEVVSVYECVEGCPVLELDRQSGEQSASRFFPQSHWDPELDGIARFLYCAKASRGERERGLEEFRARSGGEATRREDGSRGLESPRAGAGRKGGRRNPHPTVKPVELLRWLVRLVTPPEGVVLDPFAGTGSCGVASLLEGFRYCGVELMDTDAEPYVSIARARLDWITGGGYTVRESLRDTESLARQMELFGGKR